MAVDLEIHRQMMHPPGVIKSRRTRVTHRAGAGKNSYKGDIDLHFMEMVTKIRLKSALEELETRVAHPVIKRRLLDGLLVKARLSDYTLPDLAIFDDNILRESVLHHVLHLIIHNNLLDCSRDAISYRRERERYSSPLLMICSPYSITIYIYIDKYNGRSRCCWCVSRLYFLPLLLPVSGSLREPDKYATRGRAVQARRLLPPRQRCCLPGSRRCFHHLRCEGTLVGENNSTKL